MKNINNDVHEESDEDLQEAFAAGLLKPGLNDVIIRKKKDHVNNVQGLLNKLCELESISLPWIERLDLTNGLAPLAPELALWESKIGDAVNVHDDFKRESCFYRQAQSSVLEALPRLKSLGLCTKRPEDYFAQMAKTDHHMNIIREKLLSKQVSEERLEKIRKLRELRKHGKRVQVEVQQKRQKEKREMMEQVKKIRKGQSDNLDFLEGPSPKKKIISKRNESNGFKKKRSEKDRKFGFGGKIQKGNDRNSTNDFPGKTYNKKTPGSKAGGNKGRRLGKKRRSAQKNKK